MIDRSKPEKIILTPDKIYSPTIIESPTDELITGTLNLVVRGRAHPGHEIILLYKGEPRETVIADHNGQFIFPPLLLDNDTNVIEVSNVTLEAKGGTHSKASVTVKYDKTMTPYYNVVDPVTKNRFSQVDANDIVRCGRCSTYYLRDSWIAINNRCIICNNESVMEHTDERFWQP